jgi:hypothetical protein
VASLSAEIGAAAKGEEVQLTGTGERVGSRNVNDRYHRRLGFLTRRPKGSSTVWWDRRRRSWI